MKGAGLLSAFQFGTKVDNKIYGITIDSGVLVSYSIKDNEISIVGSDKEIYDVWTYSLNCCSGAGRLFFSANRGNEVLEYNLGKNTYKHHKLSGLNIGGGYMCFIDIVFFNNKVYLFPRYDENIYKYNLNKGETFDIVSSIEGGTERLCGCLDDYLFYILYNDGKLYTYNMESDEINYLGKFDEIVGTTKINMFGKELYAMKSHGDIWKLNLFESSFFQVTPCVSDDYSSGNFIKFDKQFIVLPGLSKELYAASDNYIEKIAEIPNDFERINDSGRGYFDRYIDCEDKYIFLGKRLSRYLSISKNGEIIWIEPNCPSKEEYLSVNKEFNHIIREDTFTLIDYINYI